MAAKENNEKRFRGSFEKTTETKDVILSCPETPDDLLIAVKKHDACASPMSRRQILKNVAVMSISFMFMFTAFQCVSNLQSSLNKEEGVGSGSVAIIYAALILSCMFLAPVVVAKFGCKWSIPISMVGYVLYMAANFYAVWGVMAPGAIFIGVGGGPLWSAQCTYLNQIGVWYSKMTGVSTEAIINRFFGIFFMALQTTQIWGNLISSEVFSLRPENSSLYPNKSSAELALCGANYCPQKGNESLRPPDDKVYIVCGITTASAVLAIIIAVVFLDNIVLDKEREKKEKISVRLLVATFSHLFKNRLQLLLVPLTFYIGVEQGFIAGTVTRAYITCAIGIWNIGYVMIVYGVSDAICSFTFGRLVQYVGQIPFFILAFVLHGGSLITFRLWSPNPDEILIFYILAATWGIGDAVIQTQLNSLYGCLFTDSAEAAFANYRLWQCVGYTMTYAYNDYLCADVKLSICIVFLVSGMLCFAVVKVLVKRRQTSEDDSVVTKDVKESFSSKDKPVAAVAETFISKDVSTVAEAETFISEDVSTIAEAETFISEDVSTITKDAMAISEDVSTIADNVLDIAESESFISKNV